MAEAARMCNSNIMVLRDDDEQGQGLHALQVRIACMLIDFTPLCDKQQQI
jgi:hypothetical protein